MPLSMLFRSMTVLIAVLVGVASTTAFAQPRPAERRVALVLGNSTYQNTSVLTNPANDAKAMAASLERLGFKVETALDRDRPGIIRALRDFAVTAEGADLALFFYAGHGVEVSGQNYIVPVDAALTHVRTVDLEAVPLDQVMRAMSGARARVLILDACRDNPLASKMTGPGGTRSVSRGLAPIQTQDFGGDIGTLVVFATAPGTVAQDGDGTNSPFTNALLRHIETPGLEIRQIMSRTRRDVREATRNQQDPWENASLSDDVFLKSAPVAAPVASTPAPASPGPAAPAVAPAAAPGQIDANTASVLELTFWQTTAQLNTREAYQAYKDRYPTGTFTALADASIRRLEQETIRSLAQNEERRRAEEAERLAREAAEAEARRQADERREAEARRQAEERQVAERAAEEERRRQVAALARRTPAEEEVALRLAQSDWTLIQRALTDRGFRTGGTDGIPGDRTRDAVRRFQVRAGLAETGFVNEDMIAELGLKSVGGASDAPASGSPANRRLAAFATGNLADLDGCWRSALTHPNERGFMRICVSGSRIDYTQDMRWIAENAVIKCTRPARVVDFGNRTIRLSAGQTQGEPCEGARGKQNLAREDLVCRPNERNLSVITCDIVGYRFNESNPSFTDANREFRRE